MDADNSDYHYRMSQDNYFAPIPHSGLGFPPYIAGHPNYMMVPLVHNDLVTIPQSYMFPSYQSNMYTPWAQQPAWHPNSSQEVYHNYYTDVNLHNYPVDSSLDANNMNFTKSQQDGNGNSVSTSQKHNSSAEIRIQSTSRSNKNKFGKNPGNQNRQSSGHIRTADEGAPELSSKTSFNHQSKPLHRNSNHSTEHLNINKTSDSNHEIIERKDALPGSNNNFYNETYSSHSRNNFKENSQHKSVEEKRPTPGIIHLHGGKTPNYSHSVRSKPPIFSEDEFPAMIGSFPLSSSTPADKNTTPTAPIPSYTDALLSSKTKTQSKSGSLDQHPPRVDKMSEEDDLSRTKSKTKKLSKVKSRNVDDIPSDSNVANSSGNRLNHGIITEKDVPPTLVGPQTGFSYASALKTFAKPKTEPPPPPVKVEKTAKTTSHQNKERSSKKRKKKRKVVKIDLDEAHKMLENKTAEVSISKEFSMTMEEFPDLMPIKSSVCKTVIHNDEVFDWFSIQFSTTRNADQTNIEATNQLTSVTSTSDQAHQLDDTIQTHFSAAKTKMSATTKKKRNEMHLLTMGLVSDKPVAPIKDSIPDKSLKFEAPSNPKAAPAIAVNLLDSKAPTQRRGKEKEVPKKKKVNKMKRAILQDREERRQKRLEEQEKKIQENIVVNEADVAEQKCEPIQLADIKVTDYSQSDASWCSEVSEQDTGTSESEFSATECEDTDEDDDDDATLVANKKGDKHDDIVSRLTQAIQLASQTNERMSVKSIHSRKFREYCNQIIGTAVNDCVTEILNDLVRFQDRLYHRDPNKFKLKKRLVFGIREVTKYLRLKKIKLVLLAPDIEKVVIEGGLDEAVNNILNLCRTQSVTYVFTMTRRTIGKLCHKPCPISVVGIFDYSGTETNVKRLIELVEEARKQYNEVAHN